MINIKDYEHPDHKKFIKDMEKAGLGELLRHYEGRYLWSGPGVEVSDISEAMSVTTIKCQWDNLGLDYIVYPEANSQQNFQEDFQPVELKRIENFEGKCPYCESDNLIYENTLTLDGPSVCQAYINVICKDCGKKFHEQYELNYIDSRKD